MIPLVTPQGDAAEPTDYKKIHDACFVDLKTTPPRPDVLISIGEDKRGFPIPVFTAGEFSCTVAPAKTKKSFLKSLFSAVYIGGQANNYTSHIKGHRKEDCYIIDIDTEQGHFYAHRTFSRTMKICGSEYPNYLPYRLRKMSVEERVRFTDWLICKSEYAGKVKLVLIDGIADYVEDANNLLMSNEVAGYLLKWTDEMQIHVHTIIHKTHTQEKATGHLGSAVTKKAESLIYIDPLKDDKGVIYNYNTVRVRCGVARGKMFDPFHLSINKDGLPFTHTEEDDVYDVVINKKNENTIITYDDLPKGSVSEAFGINPDQEPEDEFKF